MVILLHKSECYNVYSMRSLALGSHSFVQYIRGLKFCLIVL
jgi:hypothetical protein